MAAPLLAEAVGGQAFLGFISAVAFATILAVVAGLTLSGAAALSHDLWVHVVRDGQADEQRAAARRARRHDRAGAGRDRARHRLQGPERRLHGRARLRHRRQRQLPRPAAVDVLEPFTTARRGRQHASSARPRRWLLIYLSPTIQVDLLKHATALFPLRNPGIVTIPLSFLVGIVVSLLAPEAAAAQKFAATERQLHLGEEG